MISLRYYMKNSDASKIQTYCEINPELQVHPMYINNDIPETHRIATSRLRMSSHRLKIETGRWSRTPREERMCNCGMGIQTESHVLLYCDQTHMLRHSLPQNSDDIGDLMDNMPCNVLCKLCYDVLSLF